ncbi:MAG: hypothetical protein DME90_11695 [Verrucomicrobia bacterium]|nr:MAG: hypothetical protein DME90_11695 [Verrucomicrobiota bacterium]
MVRNTLDAWIENWIRFDQTMISVASAGSASFLEGLPILDIIKAGAAGLAVLVAILAYQITRDVVKGKADPIRAGLAKFSWKASLVLVSMMVVSELLRFFLPRPTLGIEASGWNEKDFAPLKLRIIDPTASDTELKDDYYSHEINSSLPKLTIHLENVLKRLQAQAAVNSELAKTVVKETASAEHASKPADTGPAPAP